MDLLRDLLLGALGGALLCLLGLRTRYAAPLAALRTERDLLRERVADLTERAHEADETAELVAPLRESLRRVEAQVHTLERERGDQFARVALELTRVQSSTEGLREQTASLVGSLSSANIRGSWGEVTLRRVLEASGMLARCDFDTQVSTGGSPGGGSGGPGTRRPDVVVHLPGHRHLAIDAKAPMSDFLAAHVEGRTAAERTTALRRHATALRGHVEALAAKDYWAGLPDSPELVVCFVPGEGLLAAALGADPGLHEHALRRGVVLASPATLLALLRTVALAWRHDALAQGARELLVLGRELYARIGAVGRHTEAVGEALARSVSAYNALVGSVESRLLVTARRMEQLGLGDAGSGMPPGGADGGAAEAPASGATGSPPATLDTAPRALRSPELFAALDEQVGRPELLGAAPPMLSPGPDPRSGAAAAS